MNSTAFTDDKREGNKFNNRSKALLSSVLLVVRFASIVKSTKSSFNLFLAHGLISQKDYTELLTLFPNKELGLHCNFKIFNLKWEKRKKGF